MKLKHGASMVKLLAVVLCCLTLFPSIVSAEVETLVIIHKYVMGDNDSKNDARRMCLFEAKRLLLEKAGTYIENRFSHIISERSINNEVKGSQLAKDELSAYAGALLKVDVVKEEWQLVDENMAILMTVKAEVDTGDIEKQLSRIKQDTSVQKKMKDQQSRFKELERKVVKLQKQLAIANPSQAITIRQEKEIVLKDIDEIEGRYKYLVSKRKATQGTQRATFLNEVNKFIRYVEIGMTPEEVEYILGKPDKIKKWPSVSRWDNKANKIYFVKTGKECIAWCYGRFSIPLGCGKDRKWARGINFALPIELCGERSHRVEDEGGNIVEQFIVERTLCVKDKDRNILDQDEIDRLLEIGEDRYSVECFSYIQRVILGTGQNIFEPF